MPNVNEAKHKQCVGLRFTESHVSSTANSPASTNVRATRSQTSPAASITIHQQRNHQLTPTRSWNIAPVFRSTACGQQKASTATTSATHRKLAAARTILIVTVSIVALSIIVMAGITQHGGAAGSPIGDSAQTQQNMAPSISISNASNSDPKSWALFA